MRARAGLPDLSRSLKPNEAIILLTGNYPSLESVQRLGQGLGGSAGRKGGHFYVVSAACGPDEPPLAVFLDTRARPASHCLARLEYVNLPEPWTSTYRASVEGSHEWPLQIVESALVITVD